MKHLLESSSIINDIFHERTKKIETEKKAEEDRKAREEEELQEVIEANKSLKDSLLGRGSKGSQMTMAKALSGDMSAGGKSSTKPVDTTKEFLNTINDQLHMSGAGIQIIMQESKDAQWFAAK